MSFSHTTLEYYQRAEFSSAASAECFHSQFVDTHDRVTVITVVVMFTTLRSALQHVGVCEERQSYTSEIFNVFKRSASDTSFKG